MLQTGKLRPRKALWLISSETKSFKNCYSSFKNSGNICGALWPMVQDETKELVKIVISCDKLKL